MGCDFFNLRFDQAAPDVRGEEHVFLRAPVIMEAYGFCEVVLFQNVQFSAFHLCKPVEKGAYLLRVCQHGAEGVFKAHECVQTFKGAFQKHGIIEFVRVILVHLVCLCACLPVYGVQIREDYFFPPVTDIIQNRQNTGVRHGCISHRIIHPGTSEEIFSGLVMGRTLIHSRYKDRQVSVCKKTGKPFTAFVLKKFSEIFFWCHIKTSHPILVTYIIHQNFIKTMIYSKFDFGTFSAAFHGIIDIE